MNDILLFSLIILCGIAPVCTVLLRLIFKKSVVTNVGIVILIVVAICVVLSYIIAKLGMQHLFWAAPIGVGLLFACYYFIDLKIRKPLQKLTKTLDELSDGNLYMKFGALVTNRNDELGHIVRATEKMTDKFRNALKEVFESVNALNINSQELSKTSIGITERVNEQTGSIEEIASSVEEILSNIQNNSDNANKTEQISQSAVQGITRSQKTSHEVNLAMKEIAERIKIVNEISIQTNILSLNASVEAARAGVHGKGFAVVAKEVQKLAERSKKAAAEINEISAKASKLTGDADNELSKVAPEINKTSNLLQDITLANAQQESGVEQVNSALQQLNLIAQQNASMAEELSTQSEKLQNQSNLLQDAISYFKLARK